MAREDHQPWEKPSERPDRSDAEWEDTCSRTIAYVLACGRYAGMGCGKESIAAAIRAACNAHMPAVFVFVDEAHRADAALAVDAVREETREALIELVEYDGRAAVAMTREAADFELCEISYGLLVAMRAAAERAGLEYDAIIALGAGPTGITCHHLFELCEDRMQHPDSNAVISWIAWFRRLPYLISRNFLESMDSSSLVTRRADGMRGVPHVGVRDHVFGEEILFAPASPVKGVGDFLDTCTMDALEAVHLAEFAREHPDEELHSPNQKLSLMGPVAPEPLNDADKLLVDTALDVVAARDDMPEDEAKELAWADEFGRACKRDFPLLNDRAHAGKLVYLDSAATTQRVDLALQAQHDYDLHENANVYRGAYSLSAQSTFTFNDARKALEDFIGAERRSCVYTMNTSAAIGLVAQAWGEHNVHEGDSIVCALGDHHSNTLSFAMLADRVGARMIYVPFDDDGRIDKRAYAEALACKPKLVCLTHIGNVFGIVEPVKEMAKAAHKAGARVLIDAAQSFPHEAIDVNDIGADWVAMSAHKAYGPMGLGALWISPEAFSEMDPLIGGGGTVSHVATDSYYLRPKSLQYEPGTPPVSQAVGWAAAIGYMNALGMDAIKRHSAALTRYAVRGLQRIDGVNVLGDHSGADGQMGLVSFTVRSVSPADVATYLGGLGVAIRSGGHCALPAHAEMGLAGSSRISIGVYTTRDDIDAALAAVELCRAAYERE